MAAERANREIKILTLVSRKNSEAKIGYPFRVLLPEVTDLHEQFWYPKSSCGCSGGI
jgi:hypothetical protein